MPDTSTHKARTGERPVQAAKDFVQQGADYSRNLGEKTEAVAEATRKSMQHAYSSAVSEATNFNVQWIEMIRDNTNASLDLAQQLVTAKSPSEFFELSAAHTRKQMEAFAQQAQQLAGLAQKATADAIKPMQDGMKKAFDKAA